MPAAFVRPDSLHAALRAFVSVAGATLLQQKGRRTEVLALKRQDSPVSGAATTPGLVLPAAGVAATSFAPFTPRSTPKNGESDGL
jgi:general secretion pathway protein N